MKKNTLAKLRLSILPCFLVFCFAALFVLTPCGYGDLPQKKTSEVETKLANDAHIGTNTMNPGLMTAWGGEGVGVPAVSLMATPFMVGTRGAVQYQKLGDSSYRIQYDESEGAASFFLHFQYELDLRDRWVRISYSGRSAPEKIYVVVDRLDEKRGDAHFPVYLERSAAAHDSFFKLPARMPYAKVKTLDFMIDPEDQKSKRGEFALLDVQIMPQHFDPLKGTQVKSMKVPTFKEYFQPENRVSLQAKALRGRDY